MKYEQNTVQKMNERKRIAEKYTVAKTWGKKEGKQKEKKEKWLKNIKKEENEKETLNKNRKRNFKSGKSILEKDKEGKEKSEMK